MKKRYPRKKLQKRLVQVLCNIGTRNNFSGFIFKQEDIKLIDVLEPTSLHQIHKEQHLK
ncbi:MAG: hypothetical protein SP4CHLAM5_06500 [Chlamydiia bacterium]|nr:hypothetical protein [Chlamydiia bacterium]MCH9618518.1 hypothetical protein [Chlamydiia bacterium]MCH9623807.1 hypothetical protein [Chlamydiia bacterium]